MNSFSLQGDYIELAKLLKVLNWTSSGGEAKQLIKAGEVKVNGEIELRSGRKLKAGDYVAFMDQSVTVGPKSPAEA